MKVFELDPLPGVRQTWPSWDVSLSFVIVASNEDEARKLAASSAGDEARREDGLNPWLSKLHTSCKELKADGARIVCHDFHAG